MNDQLAELRRRLGEVSDLRSALALLEWDQMVMMPPAGAAVRAERLATLERIAHERFSRRAHRRAGRRARATSRASLPYDSDDASLIRVTRRDWEKARRVPADLAGELTQGGVRGHGGVGRRARGERLRRLPAVARPPARAEARVHRVLRAGRRSVRHPARRLRAGDDDGRGAGVFDRLKEELVPLIAAAAGRRRRPRRRPVPGGRPARSSASPR